METITTCTVYALMKRLHLIAIRAVLGGVCALAVGPAQALQVVPYAEMDSWDATIDSSGWPSNSSSTNAATSLADAVVMVRDSSGSNPFAMGWWQRGVSSDQPTSWSWQGMLTPRGMPAFQSTNSSPRIASNGRDVFAVKAGTQDWRVIRRTESSWEYLGTIALPNGSESLAVSGTDIAMISFDNVLHLYRGESGAWTETWSAPTATLPAPYVHGLQIVGTQLFLAGTAYGLPSSSNPGKLLVYEISPEGSLRFKQELSPPVTPAWRLGASFATDGNWLAVEFHKMGEPSGSMAFYCRDALGEWHFQQLVNAQERPRALTAGHLMTNQGVWSLNRSVWQRGARLNGANAMFVNPDCVYANSGSGGAYIGVWRDPFDCDGDGIDDAAALAANPMLDCNANGRPDAVDISDGLLADANSNGVPDPCEPDCDLNLVPDLWQIRQGAATLCTNPQTLMTCAIASGAPDSNNDGIVDACGPDLDDDGVPDLIELAAGTGTDCNDDGIPDSVATYRPAETPYQTWVGGDSGSRIVVAAAYTTDPLNRSVTGISFGIQSEWFENHFAFEPQPVYDPIFKPYMTFLASDPNGDGDPGDAEVVWAGLGIVAAATEQFMAVPEQFIDTPGFFVGFTVPMGVFAQNPENFGYSGWEGGASCLGINAACYADCGMGFASIIPGDSPLSQAPDPKLLWQYGSMPNIRAHTDVCDHTADLNGDGTVNGADLGVLLSAWGPAASGVADFNHDGSVDGLDLGALLAQWGEP